MRGCLKHILLGLALCQSLIPAATAADSAKEIGDVVRAFTPATHYIWTDQLVYSPGDTHTLRWTFDPQGDPYPYTLFVYLENIDTGARSYVTGAGLSNGVVDYFGNAAGSYQPTALSAVSGMQIISAPVPGVGSWHFVAELRTPAGNQVIKKAWAKYVVVSGEEIITGLDAEIAGDVTWTKDTVYRLRGQLFVRNGATLTIEPGTHILASGQQAALIVQPGGKLIADGRRELPIVMTCDAPLGDRFSGCWAGLIMLGRASINVQGGTGLAEGVTPPEAGAYGGTDDDDSSGIVRFVRVEFAGVDFNQITQPNAFGFHGLGRGTIVDYIQAHEGEDDGIEHFGGTNNISHFVSDGSKDDSFDYTFGWRGTAQYGFVLQDGVEADRGWEGDNNGDGQDNLPRANPQVWNVTWVGSMTGNDGILIREGSAGAVRNAIIMGFGADGIDIADDQTVAQGTAGNITAESIILWNNGDDARSAGASQTVADNVADDMEPFLGDNVWAVNPMLRNVRFEGNPDPRPLDGSPAGMPGASVTPGSDGVTDPTGSGIIGAFGYDDNWIEEWTFFGGEELYLAP